MGTASPEKTLHVVGDTKLTGTSGADATAIEQSVTQSSSGKGGKIYIKAGDAQTLWSANHWGGDVVVKGGSGYNNSGSRFVPLSLCGAGCDPLSPTPCAAGLGCFLLESQDGTQLTTNWSCAPAALHGSTGRGRGCSTEALGCSAGLHCGVSPEFRFTANGILVLADEAAVMVDTPWNDAQTGQLRWQFATAGPIKAPPTVWEGRAYVGSGDGYVYTLEAATGRLLWRFRAAPVERRIMVYGNLCSTWPVNTGVLVHDGVAYFAAGIVDHDGTYVYALDARTGRLQWQNNTCGHLSPELRKGVSAQGNLTIHGDQLLLAGGNQVSPAAFDLAR